MKLKFWEHRNADPSGSYTTDVLNYISSSVSGQALRGTAAAIEICAGVWQRGMSSAEVTPMNARTAALTPTLLGHIGRNLCLYGEVVASIDVRRGQVTLTPAQSWVVSGGLDRDSWVYECTFQTPSGSVVRSLPSSRVLHIMYAQSSAQPWCGVSPLGQAGLTQSMLYNLESALAQEARTPTAYVVPVPDPKQAHQLTTDLRGSKGGLSLVPSTRSDAAWGMGQESTPGSDWQSMRLGMSPPLPVVELRSRAELSILAAAGVPVTILSLSDGTAKRADLARFLTLTLEPVGRIVTEQVGAALEVPDLKLDFSAASAADLASKGRVFGQLVSNGVSIADAAEVAGLPISDTTPTPPPPPPGSSNDQ